MKELDLDQDFPKQDIKFEKITSQQIEEMAKLAGSYEALFSRRSMKFKALNLKDKTLGEEDYKNLILEEYTFLKRPVFVIDNEIFIGNSKANVDSVARKLNE